MNKLIMVAILAVSLTGCKQKIDNVENISTVRHDGLCFVVYLTYDGTAMVQVECGKLDSRYNEKH